MIDGTLRPKKQPEQVRRRLLDSAAKLAANNGRTGGISLSAIASASGVTKGGLLHHFPSKQALIEAMFDDALQQLDLEIDSYLAQDTVKYGCFTRAYIKSAFASSKDNTLWAALIFSLSADPGLVTRWERWITARLVRHIETDGDPALKILRLAADGAWFITLLNDKRQDKELSRLEQQLNLLTCSPSVMVLSQDEIFD
ncbi:TPA: TetR/AcrR family transcriptional regulator [Yersinia enterocolitica]